LCELLAKSGCIAVTGGLEVASDRLLKKINKGVDIAQVAKVTQDFSKFGVMTHAYLMYGFPTQTEQETIDSLEIVRQLFVNDIEITGPEFHGFAQNDLYHIDPKGTEHHKYKTGLNLALHNYLNGVGFDLEMQDWFDFKIPETTHYPDYIENELLKL